MASFLHISLWKCTGGVDGQAAFLFSCWIFATSPSFLVLYFFRHLNEDFQFLSSALSQLCKQCAKSFTVCYLCTKQRPFSHCQLFAQIFKHKPKPCIRMRKNETKTVNVAEIGLSISEFQISWDVLTQSSLKDGKYQMSSTPLALLMSEVKGEWPDCFNMVFSWQHC